jgi:hypothetical protein
MNSQSNKLLYQKTVVLFFNILLFNHFNLKKDFLVKCWEEVNHYPCLYYLLVFLYISIYFNSFPESFVTLINTNHFIIFFFKLEMYWMLVLVQEKFFFFYLNNLYFYVLSVLLLLI